MSSLKIITEEMARTAVTPSDAFKAVRAVFRATASGNARSFPVTREKLVEQSALFGFKSGIDFENQLLGLKAGGYWSENASNGHDNHQSSVLLFEPSTGRLKAVVSGNYLTSVRTAAAAANSIDNLAKPDARTLSIVGAGKQAEPHIRAALDVRDFQSIVISNRTKSRAEHLAKRLSDLKQEVMVSEIKDSVCSADVLITIASSHAPLVEKAWVKPGTHVAAMGTDTIGKMELSPDLVVHARIFTDDVAQSVQLGEAQHAVKAGAVSEKDVTLLGAVLNGDAKGRQSLDDVTLYDGTGIGLQDLAVADLALKSAHL